MKISKKAVKKIKKILIFIGQKKVQFINSVNRLRYGFFHKNISIAKNVFFNQKTVFSGRGWVQLADGVIIGYRWGGFFYGGVTEIQARYPESKIIIQEGTAFNNSNCIVAANRIVIGPYCRIGANVTMMDFEAHGTRPEDRGKIGDIGEIEIGKNVWIGNNVFILKNTYIGDNSIIAAGSVVVKGRYPKNSIIGGNPAKIIKLIEPK